MKRYVGYSDVCNAREGAEASERRTHRRISGVSPTKCNRRPGYSMAAGVRADMRSGIGAVAGGACLMISSLSVHK